ncbi:MAG: PqqD family peptide modification chaperone [Deltaproteobacteria bacterium]|nr:PqqD family peptide modification chaperone [Deltaproteobacteria bacterium]
MNAGSGLFRPRPDLFAQRFDGGLVLADPGRRRLLAYNESAGVIWRCMAHGASADAAAEQLAGRYGIAVERARRDVAAILAHWRDVELFVESPTSRPVPQAAQTAEEPAPRRPLRAHCYALAGKVFRIGIADDELGVRVDSGLAPYRCAARDAHAALAVEPLAAGGWRLQVEGAERLRSTDAAEIVGGLYQALLEAVHGRPDWLAILHAAAVTRGALAYVLAGPSGSGKSTLAAALSADGYGYAADDMVPLLASSGHLVPWPLAHSLKSGSWPALADLYPTLDDAPAVELGAKRTKFLRPPDAAWAAEPRPVGALLFPQFDPAATPQAMRLRPLEALQRLLLDRVWLGDVASPAAVTQFLAWLQATPAFAVRYPHVAQARELIDQLI